jgi:hypothetical protein
MINEEKNPAIENDAVTENNTPDTTPAKKKISGGLLGAIIGGVVVVILAIVLLATLLPGSDKGNTPDDGGTQQGTTDTKVSYVVTVVDTDGKAVEGAVVSFTTKGGSPIPFPTDTEGKASYKTAKELTATVTAVPSGYEYAKLNQKIEFDNEGKATITLTKKAEEAPYTIKVVDQDGNPVAGVKVQMCDDAGLCLIPTATNEDGIATYKYQEGNFHVLLNTLIDGYTVDDMSTYYYFTGREVTIVITKI